MSITLFMLVFIYHPDRLLTIMIVFLEPKVNIWLYLFTLYDTDHILLIGDFYLLNSNCMDIFIICMFMFDRSILLNSFIM